MLYNNSDWQEWLEEEKNKKYFLDLKEKMSEEENNYVIYPKKEDRMKVIEQTDYEKVKVVIISDAPYVSPNQADGYAFSSIYGIPLELRNIYRKIEDELRIKCHNDSDLSRWAKQGVMLINLTYTTRANKWNSHKRIGWLDLTRKVVIRLIDDDRPKVFIFLGTQSTQLYYLMQSLNSSKKHLLLSGESPKTRFFFNTNYFIETNNFIERHYGEPIDWR